MSFAKVLAEISFSGPRAGHWQTLPTEAFMAHITMVGQIWMDHFISAGTPPATLGSSGIVVTADQAREALCRGWRHAKSLRIYRSGVKSRSGAVAEDRRRNPRYECAEPSEAFTLPKLEEVANSAHCGGQKCGYGFGCNCTCVHCGGARRREL